jgi:hypothetical protein
MNISHLPKVDETVLAMKLAESVEAFLGRSTLSWVDLIQKVTLSYNSLRRKTVELYQLRLS